MGLVFFFGAGASVAAHVPDTMGMVRDFLASQDVNSSQGKTLSAIVERLRTWSEEAPGRPLPDVELLLDVLNRLLNAKDEPLLTFWPGGNFNLPGDAARHLPDLMDDLRNFIKRACIVKEAEVSYLAHIRPFLQYNRPLDIFTVNYDTVVEQFCNVFRYTYVDGFDLDWNPKTFERTCDVRLYKLHGSVMWYLSDRGRYLKVPVLAREDKIELITREAARSLMAFPAQKLQLSEPFLDLLSRLRTALEQVDIAVVVGYTFRDEHIRNLFWEAAHKNEHLRVVLISPSATRIYEEKLKSYPEGPPSSLSERVLTLPYRFEWVLPMLLDQFVSPLRHAVSLEAAASNAAIMGQTTDWVSPAFKYAHIEWDDKAAEALGKTTVSHLKERTGEFFMRLWVSSWLRGRPDRARDSLNHFLDSLQDFDPGRMDLQLVLSPPAVVMLFPTPGGMKSVDELKVMIDLLNSILSFRVSAVKDSVKPSVEMALVLVHPLWKYLSPWKHGRLLEDDYFALDTAMKTPDVATLRQDLQTLTQTQPPDLRENLPSRLTAIERPKLQAAWSHLLRLRDLSYELPP